MSPFHIVLSRRLEIRQLGSSLRRLCPDTALDQRFESLMEVVTPAGLVTWETLKSRPRTLFVLKMRGSDLTLRGQMMHDQGSEVVTFVGSPWITDLTTIADLGLTLEDFSVADNLVDHLLLLQTQGTALSQARRLAEDLEASSAELETRARQLERLTRRLDSVLNSAGDGIYGLDGVGTVTFVNQAAARLLRMDREAMVGRPVDDVVCRETEAGEVVSARVTSTPGEPVRPETGRHRRSDGTWFDSERISAPILEDGVLAGSVVVFRDITERRAVDRMKDEFISMVSHELRTPLTSIRGALGLLGSGATGDLSPRADRMVQVATMSTDRLIRLINDILEVERMAAGKVAVHPCPTSVHSLMCMAVEEMRGLANASGVHLSAGEAEGYVMADPDRIVQTLNNLLGNAVKFSEPGAWVALVATDDGDHVRFEVRDTGPGIPEEHLEAIFEPFRQVDASDIRAKGGSGLGLAICRGLVERHGGRIWATSVLGEGTTMSFTLPRTSPVRPR